MDTLKYNLASLKSHIDTQNKLKALDAIKNVNAIISQELSNTEIVTAIEDIFSDIGTFGFLDRIFKNPLPSVKNFFESLTELFELYRLIITGHRDKIERFVNGLVTRCIQFSSLDPAPSKVKESALAALKELLASQVVDEAHIQRILQEMLETFDPTAGSGSKIAKKKLGLMGAISRNYPDIMLVYEKIYTQKVFEALDRILPQDLSHFSTSQSGATDIITGAMESLCDHLNAFPLNDDHQLTHRLYNHVKRLIACDTGIIGQSAMELFKQHSRMFRDQIYLDHLHWKAVLKNWVVRTAYEHKRFGIDASTQFHTQLAFKLEAEPNKAILESYMNEFRRVLSSSNSSFYEVRVAIRAFGILSKACKQTLPKESIQDHLTLVLQRIQQSEYGDDSENQKTFLEHLPGYIEAMGEIISTMDEISYSHLGQLETIIVQLLKDFYYLGAIQGPMVVHSLLATFRNLQRIEGNNVEEFMRSCLLQGVIWTCSHNLSFDKDFDNRDWKENITHEKFLPMWMGLIASPQILNHIFEVLFHILEKLNLRVQNVDDEKCPDKPEDFHLFFNVVDFYCDLLKRPTPSQTAIIDAWLTEYCRQMIRYTVRYPLISGFLKLLEIVVQHQSNPHEALAALLTTFLKQLLQTVQLSTGDMQIAALKLVFRYPMAVLVAQNVEDLVPVFLIGFEIGKNLMWLWVASMALACLESVIDACDGADSRQALLTEIMPVLDSFLNSKFEVSPLAQIKPKVEVTKSRKSRVKKIWPKIGDEGNELLQFQKRIVYFLGKLSLEECCYLLKSSEATKNLVKWDANQHIDLKIDSTSFYLDALLPRICHLALKSSDRNSKLEACELLHAIAVFLVANKIENEVWSKVCEVLIQLGCDSDAAIQQIIEPLLFQIIRYLSQRTHIQTVSTEKMVDTIFTMISSPGNSNLQDLSARLIKEFAASASQQDEQSNGKVHLNRLFEKLTFYSTDPDINKRRAALIVFTNLYDVTQNDDQLIAELWLDLFRNFSINFIMCEDHYRKNNLPLNLEQNEEVMNKFVEVIESKTEIFNASLKPTTDWFLVQCGALEPIYRQKCMNLFPKLVAASEVTIEEYLNEEKLLELFEDSNAFSISQNQDDEHQESHESRELWLQNVYMALDGHVWILREFQVNLSENVSSHLMATVKSFVRNVGSRRDRLGDDSFTDVYQAERIFGLESTICMKVLEWARLLELRGLDDTIERLVDISMAFIFVESDLQLRVEENDEALTFLQIIYQSNDENCQVIMKKIYEKCQVILSKILEECRDNASSATICHQKEIQLEGLYRLLSAIKSNKFRDIQSELVQRLLNSIFTDCDGTPVPLSPSAKQHLNLSMKVALTVDRQPNLIDMLFASTLQKCMHWLNTFEEPIFEHLILDMEYGIEHLFEIFDSADKNVVALMKFLMAFIGFVKKSAKQTDIQKLREVISAGISPLLTCDGITMNDDYDDYFFELFKELLSLHAPNEQFTSMSYIRPWILKFLKNPKYASNLNTKAKVLVLLPCINGPATVDDDELIDTIEDHIVCPHFPELSKKDLPPGNRKRDPYIAAVQALLNAFITTKSPALMKLIVFRTCSDPDHIMEHKLRKAFCDVNASILILRSLYGIFKMRVITEPRMTVLKRFLMPVLRSTSELLIRDFFREIYGETLETLRMRNVYDGNNGKYVHMLIDKIGALKLIEILFSKCSIEWLNSEESVLQLPNTNVSKYKCLTELYKSNTEVETKLDTPECREYMRQFHTANYLMICALVTCTQKNVHIYNNFLFRLTPWQKMFKLEENAYAPDSVEFEEYPTIKEHIVSIRNVNIRVGNVTKKHLPTTTIYHSSLSQDVTKYDLSHAVVRSNAQLGGTDDLGHVQLEKLAINKHELMPVLSAVLQFMQDKELGLPGKNRETPDWLDMLMVPFRNGHRNVRLFIAKLIDNCRDLFRPYAKHVIRGILLFLGDECAGTNMNVLVTDLCSLLIEWAAWYKADELDSHEMNRVIAFMMKHADNEMSGIRKYNFILLKSLLQLWKPAPLPYEFLMEELARSEREECLYGVELNAAVLSCDLIPWINDEDFLNVTLACLKKKKLHAQVAHLLGVMLAKISDPLTKIEDLIMELKEAFRSTKTKDQDKFGPALTKLHAIHVNFPEIVDLFLVTVIENIPKAKGNIKTKYLEMFLERLQMNQDRLYYNLVEIDINSLLNTNEFQESALQIVLKSLPYLIPTQITALSQHVNPLAKDFKPSVRLLAYNFFIYIHRNIRNEPTFGRNLAKRNACLLLSGLRDENDANRKHIANFWSTELPKPLCERLTYLLCNCYDEEIADNFLSSCTQLLLMAEILNEHAQDKWFRHQVLDDDDKQREYAVDTSWQKRTAGKLPMFSTYTVKEKEVSTMKSSSLSCKLNYLEEDEEEVEGSVNMFTPTIDPSALFTAAEFKKPFSKTQLDANVIVSSQSNFSHLRQRFLKNKEKDKKEKSLVSIKRNDQKREMSKAKRETINLLRRYRNGHYPDFNMNYLTVLLPLQALIRLDPLIAKEMFVNLFKASVSLILTEEAREEYINSLNTPIEAILLSTLSDTCLISSLLNIALTYPQRFALSPSIISTVCRSVNTYSLGALLIEERIILKDPDENPVKRRMEPNEFSEENHWLRLADMYNQLSEHDVLMGIFGEKLDIDAQLPRAINFAAQNDFEQALEILKDIHARADSDQDELNENQQFCYEMYCDCLVSLSDWNTLTMAVQDRFESYDQLWQKSWRQDVLFPYLMQGETRLLLAYKVPNILDHLQDWLHIKEKSDYIKANFAEELTMFYIANQELNRAKLVAEGNVVKFLLEWVDIDVLSEKLRLQQLEKIRITSELRLTIDGISSGSVSRLSRLYKNLPTVADSTKFWDTLLTYREFCCQDLEPLKELIQSQRMALFVSAHGQRNFGFCNSILRSFRDESDEFLLLENQLRLSTKDLDEMQKAHSSLGELVRRESTSTRVQALTRLAQMGKILFELSGTETFNAEHRILRQYGVHADTPHEFLQEAIKHLITAEAIDEGRGGTCRRIAQYSLLELKETQEKPDQLRLERQIIHYCLKAIEHEDIAARGMFPRLLQLTDLNDSEYLDLAKIFNTNIVQIPEWMFLEWIPQIISRLNLYTESYLDTLIERLACTYPNALIYPLRLALKNTNKTARIRPFLQHVLDRIETPLLNSFITNLHYLVLPLKKLQQHVLQILNLKDVHNVQHKVKAFVAAVFDDKENHGRAYKRIYSYEVQIRRLAELGPKRISDITHMFKQIQKELTDAINKEVPPILKNGMLLRDISPWLSKYQWYGNHDSIEVPGQYRGTHKPHPERHIKIVKLHYKVQVFSSLRCPMRLIMFGSDGRQHSFVVKYGEDLRQDERVEQILDVMDHKLAQNATCRAQKLSIVTYSVVPVSEVCGLLRWVPDTKKLKEVISESVTRRTKKTWTAYESQYREIVKRKIGQNMNMMEFAMHASQSREQLQEYYRYLTSTLGMDDNVLKWALQEMAASHESYFVLKNNFARSLASMCIAHWILGIGDRHLDNILMDEKTGTVVGIDFGHAFGSATRNLQIPELVPFRLTPKMLAVFAPMGTSGVIYRSMTHTLQCFRDEHESLRSCMEVFVDDPTIDWLETSYHDMSTDTDIEATWDPIDRVNMASQKLTGMNPLKITLGELAANRTAGKLHLPHNGQPCLSGYENLIMGSEHYGEEANLSADQQVTKLIGQATDAALLSTIYYGWHPWV